MNKYQKQVDKWFKEEDWKYWHPLGQMAAMMEETGELARIVNHLYGEKPKKSTEKKQELESEIGDVLYVLICLANTANIDLDKAIEKTIKKVTTRDKGRY